MKEKILLAAPTYKGKNYCQSEWIALVNSLTFQNIDVLIIDNSDTEDNYRELLKLTEGNPKFDIRYCKPGPGASVKEALNDCMQVIQKEFLESEKGYTHLFSLESDVFCYLNTIEYLLALNLPFVGLPYFHGSGLNAFYMAQDFPGLTGKDISNIMLPQKAFLETKGQLMNCYQGGIGCCLIQRWVIEKVPFRIAETPKEWFPDAFFHDDCKRQGIHYYICTENICTHINDADRWQRVIQERDAYGK